MCVLNARQNHADEPCCFLSQFVPARCDFNSLPASTVHPHGVRENSAEATCGLLLAAEPQSDGGYWFPFAQVRILVECMWAGPFLAFDITSLQFYFNLM